MRQCQCNEAHGRDFNEGIVGWWDATWGLQRETVRMEAKTDYGCLYLIRAAEKGSTRPAYHGTYQGTRGTICALHRCSIGKRNQLGLAWESDGSFDGLS